MFTRSRGRGWQSGIRSDVFLAPMIPAILAVSKMGPFGPIISVFPTPRPSSSSRNADSTSGGKTTVDRATATLREGDLRPTSTMLTPSPCGVRWENGDATVDGANDDDDDGGSFDCNVSISSAVPSARYAVVAFLN